MTKYQEPLDPEETFALNPSTTELKAALDEVTHIYRCGARCATDKRGHAQPAERSPLELVLDATDGFVPLWGPEVTLRWRFKESSLVAYADPEAVKTYVRQLLGRALQAWGDAVPVRFKESQQPWDFEIAVRTTDDCDASGCVLAQAFFPGGGQQELIMFPQMFTQPDEEQIETLCHELGHVFGLRHFFANISETAWPSQEFGDHNAFTIMNYGWQSTLTQADRDDLIRLYRDTWSGKLTQINGTPVRLMRPFSESAMPIHAPTFALRTA